MCAIMIAGQIIGGLFGVMLVWASLFNEDGQVGVTRSRGGVPTTEILLLLPNEPNVSQFNCFIIEVITTFTFVLINLLVKNGKTSPSSDGFLSGLAVSFTLLAMICISAGKSGACINPAVAIAQTIFEVTQYGNQIPGDKWVGKYFTDYIFLYLFATFLGAILAGLAHRGHLWCILNIASVKTKLEGSQTPEKVQTIQ
jgi:glycerol uptake facilitator-like aquaporin